RPRPSRSGPGASTASDSDSDSDAAGDVRSSVAHGDTINRVGDAIRRLRFDFLQFLIRILEGLILEIEGGLLLQPLSPDLRIRLHRLLKCESFPELARVGRHGPGSFDAQFLDDLPEFLDTDPEK